MTKFTIALAAIATVATASQALAANTFYGPELRTEASSTLDLGTVRSDSAGTVEIYNYHKGVIGDLIGMTDLRAGANSNVEINLGNSPKVDSIAVLKVDGQIVDTQEIEYN